MEVRLRGSSAEVVVLFGWGGSDMMDAYSPAVEVVGLRGNGHRRQNTQNKNNLWLRGMNI
jgi:hypothetical protein